MNHIKKLCELTDDEMHGMYFSNFKETSHNTEHYHHRFVPTMTLKPFEFIAE
jgi:hypothetical protein